jgi:hypothetical protein
MAMAEELIDLQIVKEEDGERFELEEGATSLNLLQKVYRSPAVALMTRMRAAMAALQFEHPKLAVTANVESGDFADQLEQAIKRTRMVPDAKPMIDAKPSSDAVDVSSDTRSPHVQASNGGKPFVPDRRFRR